ncbi:MAG: 2-oxoacid:acceptor oxidoreductase family protein [Xanthobacteraceae bacterium]|jgi:2-oxoglutarate ferredoxin oxidoreductase subunit gamma
MTRLGHQEFILAGTGGQGLVVAGVLLAEAAIREGRNVVQTQSYGIATRGGLSFAEVIIDDDEILFQQVRRPHCVLALSEEAVKKFEIWPGKGVPMLYDTTLAAVRKADNFFGHEFTRHAGDAGGVNILALATLTVFTQAVGLQSLESAVRGRFKGKSLESNLRLLAVGEKLAAGT